MDNNRKNHNNNVKDSVEPSNLKKLLADLVADMTDVTIVSTPLPQATSTVGRRSLMVEKSSRSTLEEPSSKHRQLNFDNSNDFKQCHTDDESSLGILQFDNMSNCTNLLDNDVTSTLTQLKNQNDFLDSNCERELARKVIKKYAEPFADTFSKSDKENNVNSTNLPDYKDHARIKTMRSSLPKDGKIDYEKKSTNGASIIFEPSEMTGRSSEYQNSYKITSDCPNKSKNDKNETFAAQSFSGISYNSNIAEVMEQFGNEEFMSGSKVGNQILADEISWRKNQLESVPTGEIENDRLELSCFSGVIGSGDLTVEDGRISVGEFFQRKCGTMGHLSINASDRPSLGLDTNSCKKQRKCRALVDQTVTSAVNNLDESEKNIVDSTKDPSIMSLSSIAKALQNIEEDVTPTKLIDKLMEANEKAKKQGGKITSAGQTYNILPDHRPSLPVLNVTTETRQNYGYKLSLGSKNVSQMDNEIFDDILSNRKVTDQNLRQLFGMEDYKVLQDVTLKCSDGFSLQQNSSKSENLSIPRADSSGMPSLKWKLSQLQCTPNSGSVKSNSGNEVSSLIHDTESATFNNEPNNSEPTLAMDDLSMKEKTLTPLRTSPPVKDQSFDRRKVKVGKKTQELCTCLVGIPQETDFELCNGTDRWIVCKLQLFQIQGEKDNIQLSLPNKDILIEPKGNKCFKIGVKMPRIGNFIVSVLHIPCLDMVTKNNWLLKHVMCFMPEEPDIRISTPSEDNVVNFQMITEDTSNSVSITLENRNSINVPVLMRLNQDEPELFSFNGSFNESLNDPRKQVQLLLKPKVPSTIDIDFRGTSLESFIEKIHQKGVYSAEAKLSVSVCFKENEEYPIKEIKLKGFLGSCKLDIIDTEFPLLLQPKVVKSIIIKNSGNIVVTAIINVVKSKENQNECRDFCIYPNNIILNEGDKLALQITYSPEDNKTDVERQAMIKIVIGNKASFYPVIGEKVLSDDCDSISSSHHLQSSETPQHLKSVGSSTSPQSSYYNRSGTSGRQSPCSTASGSSAVVKENITLRATHVSLVWGSVKIGKSDTQQFTVRNTGNSKLKLFVSIKSEGRCFKFSKERGSLSTSMIICLQAMESKTLFVVFTPAFAKAAAGKIFFSHYNSVKENSAISGYVKSMPLFGYGGYGKIEIYEAIKDISEQMWLSLGHLNSDGILHSKIRLMNRGDLTCFVKAKIIPKALCPSAISSWYVKPNEILLPPKQTQSVLIEFRPKKDDFPHAHRIGVIHVGTLRLIHGDEPTRLRIRRLYKKLADSDQLNPKIDYLANEFKEVVHQISKAFPNESFTQDLKLIKDSEQNLGDLCKGIVQNDIKMTIEIPADETMSMFQDNMEDSQTFYSLCSNQDNTLYFGGESFLPPE
ncbi:uncharacterized protein LOC106638742 [Copidosoma floridanum]|uniref:uncharacterized protein LOC106638742 n=1 Tax=Copidosoma floridanum TaxID=29053 RepID=UPI0006C9CF5A|nr:uncharacterized protein LOC106638742 [Copidosoma floridanum]